MRSFILLTSLCFALVACSDDDPVFVGTEQPRPGVAGEGLRKAPHDLPRPEPDRPGPGGLAGSERGHAPVQPARIDFLRIDNNSIISDRVIERYLADVEIGGPLDLEQIETAIHRIYGLGLYQNVRYELIEENDQTGLAFDLDERS